MHLYMLPGAQLLNHTAVYTRLWEPNLHAAVAYALERLNLPRKAAGRHAAAVDPGKLADGC